MIKIYYTYIYDIIYDKLNIIINFNKYSYFNKKKNYRIQNYIYYIKIWK